MTTKFKVTPEGYKRVLWDVAILWELATRGTPPDSMRDSIGRCVLLSQGCIGVEHHK